MSGMEHDTPSLCREAYDTYRRGDFGGLPESFDPDISAGVSRAEPAGQTARR